MNGGPDLSKVTVCYSSATSETSGGKEGPGWGDCPKAANEDEVFVRQRKICIFGYKQVGKTSIVEQYTQGTFSNEHLPATNRTSSKRTTRNGYEYVINVLDTVGQDECGFFDPQYTIGTDGYILVYSVIDRHSFDMVKRIYNDLWAYTPLVPFVLVANKSDLKAQVSVSGEEGWNLAKKWGCPYEEATSLSGERINEIFDKLLGRIDVSYDDTPEFAKPSIAFGTG
ncbi:GTP-binding protein rhb1 [Diplonema papillatum]|uniref:GTP-binding protein Rheb isoform 3 n=1 Tax=Diplonema papillatum TaxID=91374 RepID=A0A2R4IKU7_9EUGL|nr:GTP-binding protein Rheb isoform 3 [Diplonema papillatum]KAJ9457171.1 GTP-binding protein rhb1 [Diplonema papillatum]